MFFNVVVLAVAGLTCLMLLFSLPALVRQEGAFLETDKSLTYPASMVGVFLTLVGLGFLSYENVVVVVVVEGISLLALLFAFALQRHTGGWKFFWLLGLASHFLSAVGLVLAIVLS